MFLTSHILHLQLTTHLSLSYPRPEGVVAGDRTQQQPDISRIPVAVEEQRSCRQPGGGVAVAEPRELEEAQQHDRQVEQDEAVGIK